MNFEKLKALEDAAINLTDGWTRSMQLTIYMLLNRRHSCTMTGIEYERMKAFAKEDKGSE